MKRGALSLSHSGHCQLTPEVLPFHQTPACRHARATHELVLHHVIGADAAIAGSGVASAIVGVAVSAIAVVMAAKRLVTRARLPGDLRLVMAALLGSVWVDAEEDRAASSALCHRRLNGALIAGLRRRGPSDHERIAPDPRASDRAN
jgi:hypothetical protein